MSLGAVLNSARSSLAAISGRTQVTSENISNVDNPGYSRRIAETVASGHGVLRLSIGRAEDRDILAQMLIYTSRHAAGKALSEGLDKIGLVHGDLDSEVSPAALMSRLQADLQAFTAMPDSATAAARAVGTARDLAQSIRRGAEAAAALRRNADKEIAHSVARINGLLKKFHAANAAIITGRLSDAEMVRNADARDQILTQLAEEVDIRTVPQADGGLAIYTRGGAVLYEHGARQIGFTPSANLQAGASGGRILIDNVPVTGAGAVMKLDSGRIGGLIELRDGAAAQWEVQLDEMARGLISAFAEHDQTGAGPDAPGLFSWSGAPGLPAAGTHHPGLARDLHINALADPQAGGNAFLLRDGGMAGAAYVANGNGVSGFTGRLLELQGALDEPRDFDPAAGLSAQATVKDFAAQSVSWLQEGRAEAARRTDYDAALLTRASDSLSRATGVDLDNELEVMMRLERSYQATARVLTTVDNMLSALMNSMR